jgi:hypothetical protein
MFAGGCLRWRPLSFQGEHNFSFWSVADVEQTILVSEPRRLGPSLHIALPYGFGPFRGEADIP